LTGPIPTQFGMVLTQLTNGWILTIMHWQVLFQSRFVWGEILGLIVERLHARVVKTRMVVVTAQSEEGI
jgi:hypothetical protein